MVILGEAEERCSDFPRAIEGGETMCGWMAITSGLSMGLYWRHLSNY